LRQSTRADRQRTRGYRVLKVLPLIVRYLRTRFSFTYRRTLPMNTIDLDDYLNPEAFAVAVGLSRATLQRRIADGSLPIIHVGVTVLIPKSAIARHSKAQKAQAAQAMTS
jgi:excisionase family DNA binding protein